VMPVSTGRYLTKNTTNLGSGPIFGVGLTKRLLTPQDLS
jgi:hypothetical protein